MKNINPILSILLSILLLNVVHAEETRYISDNLFTYMHGGPSTQFRITGTIYSGEQVEVLEVNNNAKFARIRDAKGKVGWLPVDQLDEKPSIRTRVPVLEQQVNSLTEKLKNIDNNWNKKTANMQEKVANSDTVIAQLKQENARLTTELETANKKIQDISLQLDDKQRTIIQQWFMYGAGVAGSGLLLGLLLPYLLPRRKKRDRWMN